METIYIIMSILQSVAISLGVGCSTVAITQFFVAIADGKIDSSERRLMGVVYVILRVAMGLILLTSLVQAVIVYKFVGLQYLSPFTTGLWIIIVVLFANALAMTKHWIPATFGPGIQGASWYTLGIMFSLVPVGLAGFDYWQFTFAYIGMVLIFIAIVNGVMNHIKNKRA